MALIDVDYLRRQPLGLKLVDSLNTDILEETIQEASDYIEDYLDRKVLSRSYVERVLGNRGYVIILDNYPITALTSISYDGMAGDVGTHAPSDFLVHSQEGMIEWINKMYNFRGDRVYTITYTAGYATVPGPIKRATALQTVQLLRPAFGGPTTDEVFPYADELITGLLEKYRRKRLS